MSTAQRAAIIAVAKNEGVYLHEWIAYHKILGFDDILLYDNESTDGGSELLDELQEQGMVTRVPWSVPPDVPPQTSGYRDGLARLGEDYGWIAFIDLDEFFVLPRHETIHDFLDEFGGDNAIGVNWKNFGSSGEEHYRPDPVIDRFRRCSEPGYGRNLRVKALGPTKYLNPPASSVHKPKLKPPARFLDISGQKIENGRSGRVHHDTIRLNHYYTKSLEEWRWKQARGRGGKPAALADRKHWYPDFEDRDRNEAVESDIVKRLPELQELMKKTRPRTQPSLPPESRPEQPEAGAEASSQAVPLARPQQSAYSPSDEGEQERVIAPVHIDDDQAAELAQQALPALQQLGWIASRRRKRPVDADFNPIPWYTYPAIAFVTDRVRPDMNVFEFGSGLSTLWWAGHAASVTSVEHDEGWFGQMQGRVPGNVHLHHVELEADGDYCRTAARVDTGPFDVIVIDGRDRVNCALNGVEALSDRGVIIWDNADRGKYRPGFDYLAEQGFRRVPFIGMGPRLARVWETAVLYRDGNCFGL
jgi:hypothetical protein